MGLISAMRPFLQKASQFKKKMDAAGLPQKRSLLLAGVWLTVNRYRPLFSYQNTELGIRERIERLLAEITISFCETCVKALPSLDRLAKRPKPASSELSQLTCMMVIGSLGAGGAEQQLVTLVKELNRQQTFKRIVVACLGLSTAAAKFHRPNLEAIGVEIIDMNANIGRPLPKYYQTLAEYFPSWARSRITVYLHAMDQVRPDILHLWMDECNVIGGLAGLCCGVPAILMSARSQAPLHFALHQPWMRVGYRALLQQAGVKLYTNSYCGAKDYAQWLKLPRDAIGHVYNGFEMPRSVEETSEHVKVLERLTADHEGKTLKLMAVGRLSEEKQPFYLIAMFKEILRIEPGAHLLWVGDGILAQAVEHALNGLPASHVTRVRHSRHVTALMALSDAVILPSRIEGLPNVLIEAQSLGKPVFTPSAGGAIETFANGVSGAMLPARAPKEAGRLVVTLMREGRISTQAAEKAPAFIAETFGISVMAQNTIHLYKSLTTAFRPDETRVAPMKQVVERVYSEDGSNRFGFGKNWYQFITTHFGPEVIASAKKHFLDFMKRDNLNGIRMIDIGSGSGLHSVAALEAGVSSIHGFDYDPNSVSASRFVHEKIGSPSNWTIEQGSVLDKEYMDRLGTFDLVYSWGVLHHTGDVWTAMEHAGQRVAPNGFLYIALYSADVQIDPTPEQWLHIKKSYVMGSKLKKRWIELWYIMRFMFGSNPSNWWPAIKRFSADNGRGMRVMTDIRDWVGGWPMEFVWDKDAVAFYEARGFKLVNIATGEANTEFLFQKVSG